MTIPISVRYHLIHQVHREYPPTEFHSEESIL